MDIITAEQRSRNMAAIRSRNTRPELYMRKLLFSMGYRYSINSKKSARTSGYLSEKI